MSLQCSKMSADHQGHAVKADLVKLLKHLSTKVVLCSLLEKHLPAAHPPVHVSQPLKVLFRLLTLVCSICLHLFLLFLEAYMPAPTEKQFEMVRWRICIKKSLRSARRSLNCNE